MHADSAQPSITISPAPASGNRIGIMCNWMSGASRLGSVRKNPPDSAKFELSGPRPSVWMRPRFSSVSAVSNEGSSVV